MVMEVKLVGLSCRVAACRLGTPNLVETLGSPTGAAAEAHLEDRSAAAAAAVDRPGDLRRQAGDQGPLAPVVAPSGRRSGSLRRPGLPVDP